MDEAELSSMSLEELSQSASDLQSLLRGESII
jgi:hypothetical protein